MIKQNIKNVRNVLLIIFFANISVAVLKIVIGGLVKSTSMTADGFHSLSDGTSNIVGLIGIWLSSKPVDDEHPYGHSKFEILAGLFIGIMLSFVGLNIVLGAFERFNNPTSLQITFESILSLILTLLINIFVSNYEYKTGKRYQSQILVSDSMHTKADIYVSIGVLITITAVKLGVPSIIDPIASLVVALFIFHAVFEIFHENCGVLLDRAVVDSDMVRKIVFEFTEVKNVHRIRSRGTAGDIYIDLHIMTDPDMSVEVSHRLIHSIEDRMKKEFSENTQVIVHLEPYYSLTKKGELV